MFCGQQRQHILGDGFRLIAVEGFAAIGITAKIGRNKTVATRKPFNDRQELAMVLRPAVHTQHNRPIACGDVMLKQTVGNNFVMSWSLHKFLLNDIASARIAFVVRVRRTLFFSALSSARLAVSERFAARGEPSCRRIPPQCRKPRPAVEATSSMRRSVPFAPSRVAIR